MSFKSDQAAFNKRMKEENNQGLTNIRGPYAKDMSEPFYRDQQLFNIKHELDDQMSYLSRPNTETKLPSLDRTQQQSQSQSNINYMNRQDTASKLPQPVKNTPQNNFNYMDRQDSASRLPQPIKSTPQIKQPNLNVPMTNYTDMQGMNVPMAEERSRQEKENSLLEKIKKGDEKFKQERKNRTPQEKAIELITGVDAGMLKGAAKGAAAGALNILSGATFRPGSGSLLLGNDATGNPILDDQLARQRNAQIIQSYLGANQNDTTLSKAGNLIGKTAVDIAAMGPSMGAGEAVTAKLAGATGKELLPRIAGGAVTGAITGGMQGYSQGLEAPEMAKEAARSALFFGAGSGGSELTGKALDNMLINRGLQNNVPAYIGEQIGKGLAFSTAGTAATYPTYGKDEKPTAGEIGQQFLLGAAMDAVRGIAAIPGLKENSKAVIENSGNTLRQSMSYIDEMEKIGSTNPEFMNNLYDSCQTELAKTKYELNTTRLLGQEANVKEYNRVLNAISSELERRRALYNSNVKGGNTNYTKTNVSNSTSVDAYRGTTPYTTRGERKGKPYTTVDNGTIYQPGEGQKPSKPMSNEEIMQISTKEGYQRVGKPYMNVDNGTIYQSGENTKALENKQKQYYAIFNGNTIPLGNKALNDKLNEINAKGGDIYKMIIKGKERIVKVYDGEGETAISIVSPGLIKPEYKKLEPIVVEDRAKETTNQNNSTSLAHVEPSKEIDNSPYNSSPKEENQIQANIEQNNAISENEATNPIEEWKSKSHVALNREEIARSYSWSSMNPEGRADSDIRSVNAEIEKVADAVNGMEIAQKYPKEAIELLEQFKAGLITRYQSTISAGSKVANPMVTGPAKFNYAKNARANERYIAKVNDQLAYVENAPKMILKKLNALMTPEEKAEHKANSVLSDVNKKLGYIKENGGYGGASKVNLQAKLERTAKNGDVEAVKQSIQVIKDFQEKEHITVFTKANKIWKLAEVAEANLKAREEASEAEAKNYTTDHGEVFDVTYDGERNQVNLKFDGKPSDETRSELKENGFRWYGKMGVWYAKNTPRTQRYMLKYGKQTSTSSEIDIKDENVQSKVKEESTKHIEENIQTNKENRGKKVTIYTDDQKGIELQYKVVDAKDLITSHNTSLTVNQSYPQELQPRDRTREGSKMQIEGILAKLNPYKLGESNNFTEGAPIVGKDNIVESGNGRTLALMTGYENKNPNIEEYKRYIINHAKDFGINENELPMQPILVRERLTDVDRKEFTKLANTNSIQQMSQSEIAKQDASIMSDKMISLIDENSNIEKFNTLSNKAFIKDFIEACIPENDRNAYMDKSGYLSTQGLMRLRNAIFAKTYGGTKTIELLTESPVINIKNVINSMVNIAPKVLKVKNYIKEGKCYPCDISEVLEQAATRLTQLKSEGKSVKELRQQMGLFDREDETVLNMLEILDTNMRSTQKLTDFLKTYYDILEKCGEPNQISFVKKEAPSINALLVSTKEVMEREGKTISLWEMEQPTGTRNSEKVQSNKKARRNEEEGYTSTVRGPQLRNGNGSNTDVAGTKKPSEIFREFGEKLDMSISDRPTRGTLGSHNRRTHLVKIKKANDLTVLSHETGHFLDKEFHLTQNVSEEMIKELVTAGQFTSPEGSTPKYIMGEGVAEFTRCYLTDPESAKLLFPTFIKHFENMIDDKTATALNELQSDIDKFINLPARDKVKKTISMSEENSNKKLDIGKAAEKFYAAIYDRTHPLIWASKKMAGEERADVIKEALGVSRGYAGMAEYCLNTNQTDAYNNEIGPSLEKILSPTLKNKAMEEDFITYCVARRAEDYFQRGLEFPSDRLDCAKSVIEFEQLHPDFKETFEKLVTYSQNNLHQLVEIGMISEKTFKEICEKNPNYVPCLRVFNEVAKQYSSVRDTQPVKTLKGGGQDIVNPIESIIQSTFIYKKAVNDYLVKKEFFDITDSSENIGSLVIKQTKPMRPTTINLQVFKNEIQDILTKAGVEESAYQDLDLDIAKTLFFENAVCKENEIAIRRNDQIDIYKVDPLIYYAYSKSPIKNEAVNKCINVLSKLNNVKRAGIIFTPRYIGFNFSRDTVGNLTNTRAGITPTDVAKGIVEATSQGDVYKLFKRSGGQVSFFSSERDFSQNILKELETTHKQAQTMNDITKKIMKTSKEVVDRYGFKPSELAGRLAEFEKTLVTEYKKQYGEATNKEIINACLSNPTKYRRIINKATFNARDITIDFNRSGGLIKDLQLNRIITFSNAGIQGAEKTIRVYVDKKTRGRAIVRTSILMALSMGIYTYLKEHNENYSEIPDYKLDYYLCIPTGDVKTSKEFLTIPLEYGVGCFALATPRRLYDYFADQDKESFKGYSDVLKQSFNLDMSLPDMLELYMNLSSNKDWTGKPILSYGDTQKPAYLQYNSGTSELSKKVGEITKNSPVDLGVLQSPKQLDYVIKTQLGTMGKIGLNTIDQMAGTKEGLPLLSGFGQGFTYQEYGANTIEDYYNLRSKVSMDLKEVKETGITGKYDVKGLNDSMNLYDNYIDKCNKIIYSKASSKSEKESAEKQKLECMKLAVKTCKEYIK